MVFTTSLFSQRNSGTWNRTTKQIQEGVIDENLIGKWESSVGEPLLSFYLNEDRTLRFFIHDSLVLDSSFMWTNPEIYWSVRGMDLYIATPKKEKNKWTYTRLGIYYLRKDKLYISNCCDDIDCLKKFLKSDLWKQDKTVCVNELIRIEE